MGGGLFTGLGIALSGMNAQQDVLAVTANNIANASTPGYSVQQAELQANPPYAPPAMDQSAAPEQMGMGVTVGAVQRQSSNFLSRQLWNVQSQLGGSSEQSTALGQVQSMLNEPSNTGLNVAMDNFWNAWQSFANDAGSSAARTQVTSAATQLTGQFNTLADQLTQTQSSLNNQVGQDVGQINQWAGQIAALNKQIGAATAAGQSPNDLADSRDALIGKVANLVPVGVTWQANGEANVSVGSVGLVHGANTEQLVATPNPSNNNFYSLSWSPGGMAAQISGGALGATLTLRDTTLSGYQQSLNTLASGLAAAVNTQHQAGYDEQGTAGAAFFVSSGGPLDASTLTVNQALISDPALLAGAASPTSGPGDGGNAQAIANLQNSNFLAGGTQTPGGALASLVGQVGSDTQAAQNAQSNLQTLQQSIQTQQQQVSGVSLNDQLTTMVEAQNAYAAAARVAATVNSMLGTLMNVVQ